MAILTFELGGDDTHIRPEMILWLKQHKVYTPGMTNKEASMIRGEIVLSRADIKKCSLATKDIGDLNFIFNKGDH